jgi:acetyl-CoA carboxylase biotin carboxyl carrier protein
MDLRKIKTLIDLVSESGISELEITEGEDKVRIVKHALTPTGVQAMPQSLAYYPQAVPTVSAVSAAPIEPETIEEATGHIVKSPMVGTFYRASSPGGDPFVQVGSPVKEGAPLCIIEAMKLLNEIESDFTGIVKAILVDNGQPVEYGQPLFELE